jgi:hypothetical protein
MSATWRPHLWSVQWLGGTRADAYRRDSFHFQDGGVDNSAQWIELARFRVGTDRLFPVGLIEAL